MAQAPLRAVRRFIYGSSRTGEQIIIGAELETCLHRVGFPRSREQERRKACTQRRCEVCRDEAEDAPPEVPAAAAPPPPPPEPPPPALNPRAIENLGTMGQIHALRSLLQDMGSIEALKKTALSAARFLTLPDGAEKAECLAQMERGVKQLGLL